MKFQEFVKTKSYSAPDAIAALDCGFKFYPEWRPAIKEFLSNEGCPVIFTEFNQGDQVGGTIEHKFNHGSANMAKSLQKSETCIPLQRDNLALVESLGPVEGSVPARRNPFCSRRPVRDEIFHSSDRLIIPPAFRDTRDKKPENQARIIVYRYILTMSNQTC